MTFDKLYQLTTESSSNLVTLNQYTKFDEVLPLNTLRVYRSDSTPNKNKYYSGAHAGTKQQALIRADYMVNDEERYEQYYLYELTLSFNNIYPELVSDDGSNHSSNYVDEFKDYDILFYKNTGEGDIRNENLSVIIVNPDIVIDSKVIDKLNSSYLVSIQDELY